MEKFLPFMMLNQIYIYTTTKNQNGRWFLCGPGGNSDDPEPVDDDIKSQLHVKQPTTARRWILIPM